MSRHRILIVDDDDTNILLLENLLEDDFALETAKNGREAIEKANRFVPDVVLLDVMMPVMNGYEACRKLRRDTRFGTIPIFMISAKTSTEDRQLGFDAGATAYVGKPADLFDLLADIERHLSAQPGQQRAH